MLNRTLILVLAAALGSARLAQAKNVYYDIQLRDLKLVDGHIPEQSDRNWEYYHLVVNRPCEACLTGSAAGLPTRNMLGDNHLAIRAPEGMEVKGRLVFCNADAAEKDVFLRFVVPASPSSRATKEHFLRAKLATYEGMLAQGVPGGAWFRHQARMARLELNMSNEVPQAGPGPNPSEREGLVAAYDLFTGGRAISENLRLDRVLPPRDANGTPVKLDSLQGITINEIDWKPFLGDTKPDLDPLAQKIPADQHVVFFPSVQAALAMRDEAKLHDTPVLQLAQPRSEDPGVVERYQHQLGLPFGTLAQLLGPSLVKSAALTGSDPSFPLGTDVAVLLECSQPAALANLLLSHIAAAAGDVKDAKPVTGTIAGLHYSGFVSPDRAVSSYVAQMDGAVVVTNSVYQLQQLAAVAGGSMKPVASLPEYKFFRVRYPRGDAEESALIFLSDATIRRWCGPRWRIADARRAHARAVLAELQASQLESLVLGKVEPGPIHTDLPVLGGGTLRLKPGGVVSSIYGTLNFMTPVAEMPMEEVTRTEADAYQAWRDSYQRNWRWAFDPIGLRIGLGKQKVSADLTVMPLSMASDYDRFAEISRGANFGPRAGDPHKALAQFVLALNHQFVRKLFSRDKDGQDEDGTSPFLAWIGSSVSVYADDDPFWDELAKVRADEVEGFMKKNIGRLPVAVRADFNDREKLAKFLDSCKGLCSLVNFRWDSLKYKDQDYGRFSPREGRTRVSQT